MSDENEITCRAVELPSGTALFRSADPPTEGDLELAEEFAQFVKDRKINLALNRAEFDRERNGRWTDDYGLCDECGAPLVEHTRLGCPADALLWPR